MDAIIRSRTMAVVPISNGDLLVRVGVFVALIAVRLLCDAHPALTRASLLQVYLMVWTASDIPAPGDFAL